VALGTELREEGLQFHLILNAYGEPLEFELPTLESGRTWRHWIDTALASPEDIVPWQAARKVPGNTYRVGSRSVATLIGDTA
jgi:isoamylase